MKHIARIIRLDRLFESVQRGVENFRTSSGQDVVYYITGPIPQARILDARKLGINVTKPYKDLDLHLFSAVLLEKGKKKKKRKDKGDHAVLSHQPKPQWMGSNGRPIESGDINALRAFLLRLSHGLYDAEIAEATFKPCWFTLEAVTEFDVVKNDRSWLEDYLSNNYGLRARRLLHTRTIEVFHPGYKKPEPGKVETFNLNDLPTGFEFPEPFKAYCKSLVMELVEEYMAKEKKPNQVFIDGESLTHDRERGEPVDLVKDGTYTVGNFLKALDLLDDEKIHPETLHGNKYLIGKISRESKQTLSDNDLEWSVTNGVISLSYEPDKGELDSKKPKPVGPMTVESFFHYLRKNPEAIRHGNFNAVAFTIAKVKDWERKAGIEFSSLLEDLNDEYGLDLVIRETVERKTTWIRVEQENINDELSVPGLESPEMQKALEADAKKLEDLQPTPKLVSSGARTVYNFITELDTQPIIDAIATNSFVPRDFDEEDVDDFEDENTITLRGRVESRGLKMKKLKTGKGRYCVWRVYQDVPDEEKTVEFKAEETPISWHEFKRQIEAGELALETMEYTPRQVYVSNNMKSKGNLDWLWNRGMKFTRKSPEMILVAFDPLLLKENQTDPIDGEASAFGAP